jgi:hypothetical protein
MAYPTCPECVSEYVKRVQRKGLVEHFLSFFCLYPFCCQLCGCRFRFFKRGVRYGRVDEDQRLYERLPVAFPATLTIQNETASGKVIEISMSGCTIQAEKGLAPKTVCRLSLQPAQDDPAITVAAALVRNVHHNRIGLEFVRMEKAAREGLQGYMSKLLLLQPMVEGEPLEQVTEYKTVNWTL